MSSLQSYGQSGRVVSPNHPPDKLHAAFSIEEVLCYGRKQGQEAKEVALIGKGAPSIAQLSSQDSPPCSGVSSSKESVETSADAWEKTELQLHPLCLSSEGVCSGLKAIGVVALPTMRNDGTEIAMACGKTHAGTVLPLQSPIGFDSALPTSLSASVSQYEPKCVGLDTLNSPIVADVKTLCPTCGSDIEHFMYVENSALFPSVRCKNYSCGWWS
jgi:hypothetical protein